MNLQVVLYIMTTVIYFMIRFTVIGLIGWHLRNFNLGDTGRMFTAILGLGCHHISGCLFFVESIQVSNRCDSRFLLGAIHADWKRSYSFNRLVHCQI